jgi:DDE superfamily endonuclease
VFVIVDNGSDHRGQAAVKQLHDAWPNAIMICTPVHTSWLNQAEIFFSITQKKVISPNDFASLEKLAGTLLAFVDRYNQTARPGSSTGSAPASTPPETGRTTGGSLTTLDELPASPA